MFERLIVKEEKPGMGHNSKNKPVIVPKEEKDAPHSSVTKAAYTGDAQDVGGVAGKRIRAFIERVERLEEEKANFVQDIKETYSEAKGVGFDVKTLRKIVALRKMDVEKRREASELLDLYKTSIGMF